MIFGLRDRVLERLAFRYYLKNPRRSAKTNWALAEKFLQKLEKRYRVQR